MVKNYCTTHSDEWTKAAAEGRRLATKSRVRRELEFLSNEIDNLNLNEVAKRIHHKQQLVASVLRELKGDAWVEQARSRALSAWYKTRPAESKALQVSKLVVGHQKWWRSLTDGQKNDLRTKYSVGVSRALKNRSEEAKLLTKSKHSKIMKRQWSDSEWKRIMISKLWANPNSPNRLHAYEEHSIRMKKMFEEHPERLVQLTERILNVSPWKSLAHYDHFHRSKPELKFCEELIRIYDAGLLVANVRIHGIEVDWVIGTQKSDPSTWLEVIEHHYIRTWEGETAESYITKRTVAIRQIGASCQIAFVLVVGGKRTIISVPSTQLLKNSGGISLP